MSYLPLRAYAGMITYPALVFKEKPYRILFVKEFLKTKKLEGIIQNTPKENTGKRIYNIYEPMPDLDIVPDLELPKVEIIWPKTKYIKK